MALVVMKLVIFLCWQQFRRTFTVSTTRFMLPFLTTKRDPLQCLSRHFSSLGYVLGIVWSMISTADNRLVDFSLVFCVGVASASMLTSLWDNVLS